LEVRLVLDASAAASWAFPDERGAHARTLRARLRRERALVPALWPFEVNNILLVGERRGRLALRELERFWRDLARLPIDVVEPPAASEPRRILALARASGLTVYDASYLELARQRRLPLGTLDEPLARAALARGVPRA
jgi:predicted nucleic acid-binding protein